MDNCHTITKTLGIITCQVSTGNEDSIVDQLSKKEGGFCNSDLFFDAISDFDLIGIVDDINCRETRKKIDKFSCNSDFLKDIQLITCFSLNAASTPDILKTGHNALTVTLIQASGDLCENRAEVGLDYEFGYAQRLYDSLQILREQGKFDFEIFGTLGIPNMILLQMGDDLSVLLSNLTRLHGNNLYSEALYFHTIPCIKRIRENNLWHLAHVKGKAYWRIGVSCYNTQPSIFIPSLIKKQENLVNYFSGNQSKHPDNVQAHTLTDYLTIDFAYGKRDIIIRPKTSIANTDTSDCSTLDIVFLCKVLTAISELTKENNLSNSIETKTELFIDHQDENICHIDLNLPVSDKDIRLRPDISCDFVDWYREAQVLYEKELDYKHPQFIYGKRVIDLIERFQLTFNMPQMWELVYDMKFFLGKVIIPLIKSISNELPIYPEMDCSKNILLWFQFLEEDIQVFNYALDKRLAGVDLGIGNRVVSNISGLGNFRTLLAAKAVSHSLFIDANSFWDGFTIFSFNPLTSCLPSGVINMPDYSLDDLIPWSQIGHETGHAYVVQNNIIETVPFIQELSNSLFESNQMGLKTKEECDYFIEELMADIFEYLFCYGGNFRIYRDTKWTNLDHDLMNSISSDEVSLHLLRTICILFIHLENEGLLEKGKGIDGVLGKETGFSMIYTNPSVEEGVKLHILGREDNFTICVQKNIIDPLIRRDKFIHISFEISRFDIQLLENVYHVIDKYRSNLFSIFKTPISIDENISTSLCFERGNWNTTISNIKDAIRENQIYRIDREKPVDVACLLIAIQDLNQDLKNDLSKNLSVILSLWDYYRQEFKSQLMEARNHQ